MTDLSRRKLFSSGLIATIAGLIGIRMQPGIAAPAIITPSAKAV